MSSAQLVRRVRRRVRVHLPRRLAQQVRAQAEHPGRAQAPRAQARLQPGPGVGLLQQCWQDDLKVVVGLDNANLI